MTELNRQNRTFFNVHDDTWISLALWSILSSEGIIGSLNKIINFLLEKETIWDTALVTPMLWVFIALGTVAAIKRIQRRDIILIFTIILFWILSFFINEHSRIMMQMNYFKPVIIDGICGIICIAEFKDWERFKKVGKTFVTIGLLLYITVVLLNILGEIEIQYMATTYASLIFVIAAWLLTIHNKSVWFGLLAGLGTIAILISGNRGGLLCVAAYVVLEFMINRKIKILTKVLFFLAIVLLLFNVENIMYSVGQTLSKYDYESRTIDKFIEGTIEDDSGRKEYRKASWEVIKERPLFGCGMAGSSYHLYKKVYGVTPTETSRTYSHNFFYDILLDYGVVMGPIILMVIFIGLFGALKRSTKRKNVEILFLMFSIIGPKLMLSSTYVAESLFFIFLGLILNFNCVVYENDKLTEVEK